MTKHDRTITTTETYYTLEISEQERAELVRALGPLRRDAVVTPVYRALRDAKDQTAESVPSAPLAVGDQLRITSELAGAVDDHVGDHGPFTHGEIVTVRALADSDGDLGVDRTRGAPWDYLAESGPNAQWERVTKPAPLAVGDTVVILQDEAAGADVRTGDRLTVSEVEVLGGGFFRTEAPRAARDYWSFRYAAEGRHWKRVG